MTYHKTELYKSMYLTLYVRKVKFKKKNITAIIHHTIQSRNYFVSQVLIIVIHLR